MGMSGSFRIIEMSNHIAKNVESNVSNLQDQTRSRFALRRILETVRGCKEEMWKEMYLVYEESLCEMFLEVLEEGQRQSSHHGGKFGGLRKYSVLNVFS